MKFVLTCPELAKKLHHFFNFLQDSLITQENVTKLETCAVYKQVRSMLMKSFRLLNSD